jgi:hypothetical protein
MYTNIKGRNVSISIDQLVAYGKLGNDHKLHGSASYVKDYLPFLWEHALFDPPVKLNPFTE